MVYCAPLAGSLRAARARAAKVIVVDRLRQDDLQRARNTPPALKLREALEAMAAGIRLKRVSLRRRHPHASEEELDAMLHAWLERDD